MKLKDILLEAVSKEQALQILGLSRNYTADELKSAIRKKRSEHHPDRSGDLEKMKMVNQAADELQGSGGSSRPSTSPDEYRENREAQNKKWNDLAKVVSAEIVSKFKPKIFVVGDTKTDFGSHSHAGITVEFFSADKKLAFDFADFSLAMKNEVGAKRWNEDSFLFSTQDGHILITRMVFQRIPSWFVKVGDLKEKYSFNGASVGTFPEDTGTIDKLIKARKMTNDRAINFLKEKHIDATA